MPTRKRPPIVWPENGLGSSSDDQPEGETVNHGPGDGVEGAHDPKLQEKRRKIKITHHDPPRGTNGVGE